MFGFNRRDKQHKQPDRTIGSDGYRQCDRRIITEFQAIIERESDCDYSALAAALRKARDPNFVVTMINLRAAYNDCIYSSAQVAYVRR